MEVWETVGRRGRTGGLVSALAIALALLAPAVSAETRPTGPLTPPSGAWFGAFPNADKSDGVRGGQAEILALETAIGRKLDVVNRFYTWWTPVPTALESWDVENGRIPMVSWGVRDTYVINSGAEDWWIRQQARRLRDLGSPFFLRFYWEMEADYRRSIVHSPADLIAAWRRVHRIFIEEGATNAVWVWCPTAWKFISKNPWPPNYYPGNAYVDWVAADGYNWYPARPGSRWRTFTEILKPWYDWAVTTGKPLMIAENGVQEDPAVPGRKATWLRDERAQMKTAFPMVQAILYFDTQIVKGGITYEWRIRSTTSSLNAFKEMGADPYFDP